MVDMYNDINHVIKNNVNKILLMDCLQTAFSAPARTISWSGMFYPLFVHFMIRLFFLQEASLYPTPPAGTACSWYWASSSPRGLLWIAQWRTFHLLMTELPIRLKPPQGPFSQNTCSANVLLNHSGQHPSLVSLNVSVLWNSKPYQKPLEYIPSGFNIANLIWGIIQLYRRPSSM